MKNNLISLFIFLTWFVGLLLSLIQLYPDAGEVVHPKIASYLYILSALIILGLLILQKNISLKIKLINSFLIFLFTFTGILLALICFYALEDGKLVDILAGSLFFFSSMLPASYIFVLLNAENRL